VIGKPANRAALSSSLSRLGVRVYEAVDGTRALAALASASDAGLRMDLVLVDSQLPDGDGREVAARMRRGPAGPGLPIIIATTLADRIVDSEFIPLVKPIKQSRLVEALLQALTGSATDVQDMTKTLRL
jgi:CheY-like chemotaxis protein